MQARFLAALLTLALAAAEAAVTPQEAEQLGKNLTPVGAERAGNADGSIPAWDGGLVTAPAGFVPGGHYPDPYAGEQPLFVIDASNLPKYQEHLSVGQQALLKRYPDWRLPVYPTHRSAALPQGMYEETRRNATTVQLVEGGNGLVGTRGGVPFPIPKTGQEAIWNHLLGYAGDSYAESWAQAAVTPQGDYTLVDFDYLYLFGYGNQKLKPEQREPNLLIYITQTITAPPRLAGLVTLVHEYVDHVSQPRKAWTYNPGQRRLRLAPQVAYDNPGNGADGLRTSDDFSMYNGAIDRYEWTLLGKRELYVPYNSYRLNSNTLRIRDILRKGHINPEPTRYELHRVWVVDSRLKPGTSHIYKRRTFYLDEDSWKVVAVDKYDNRDQLWRVDEAHNLVYYDVPYLAQGLEVKHDLLSGRYLAMRLRNEEKFVHQELPLTAADFTPDAVRARGTR